MKFLDKKGIITITYSNFLYKKMTGLTRRMTLSIIVSNISFIVAVGACE